MNKLFIIFILLTATHTSFADNLYEAKTAVKLHHYEKAVKLFTIEAKKNNAEAQYHLGTLYHAGKGTARNYKQAFYWFKKSADNGNVRAQYNCGILFEHGYGVEADNDKALRWYKMAAEKGHQKSKMKLSSLTEIKNNPLSDEDIFKEIQDKKTSAVKKLVKDCRNIDKKDTHKDTPLLASIKYGNFEIFQLILNCNPELDIKDTNGHSPLTLAIQAKKEKMVKVLARKDRSSVNTPSHSGVTPLMMAVANNDEKSVRHLIENGAEINASDSRGNTAFKLAAIKQYKPIMALLKSKGAKGQDSAEKTFNIKNLEQQDGEWPILIKAAWRGQLDLVESILKQKSNVNVKDKDGNTALMRASERGHLDVVKTLLKFHASPTLDNKDGDSALMMAATNGHSEICKILLENKAKINKQNNQGMSAILIASSKGHVKTINELLKYRANLDLKDAKKRDILKIAQDNQKQEVILFLLNNKLVKLNNDDLNSLLQYSAIYGHTKLIQSLIHKGADINNTESGGNTPLILAASNGNVDAVKLLITNNAKINLKNTYGYTALMLSAKSGNLKIVNLLLENKADVNLRNKDRKSAYELAESNGHKEVLANIKKAEKNSRFLGIF